MRFVHLVSDN